MFFFYSARNFMTCFPDDNQGDIIEAFNLTFTYLDDLFNIDNPGMVIYPPELQLINLKKMLEIPRPLFGISIYF